MTTTQTNQTVIAEHEVPGRPVVIKIIKIEGLKTQFLVEEYTYGHRNGWSLLRTEGEARRDANARWSAARDRISSTLDGTYWVVGDDDVYKIVPGKRGQYAKQLMAGRFAYAPGKLTEIFSRGRQVVDAGLIAQLDTIR